MERRAPHRIVTVLTAAAILLVAWAAWSFTWSVVSPDPSGPGPATRSPGGIRIIRQEQPSACVPPPNTSPYLCWNANRPKTFQ